MKARRFFYLIALFCALTGFTNLNFWGDLPDQASSSVTIREQDGDKPTADPLVLEDDAQSTSGPIPPFTLRLKEPQSPPAGEGIVLDVPAYIWYHGCGPTAVGMVLGYWDSHGFDYLIPGDATEQTEAVNQAISSSGNYYDYCKPIDNYGEGPSPRPDLSEAPIGDEHPDDSIADFMETSQSVHENYYGWSWYSKVDDAFKGYVEFTTPEYTAMAVNLRWGAFTWEIYKAEIDAGRPVVLLVDSNEDGWTDHFVTAIGYSEVNGEQMFACHDTWDIGVHWYEFKKVQSGQLYGIYGATLFNITTFSKVSPQPASEGQLPYTRLQWSDIHGDGTFEYCVDTIDNDTCDSEWVNVGNDTQVMLSNLALGTTYYWTVRYSNRNGVTSSNEGEWWQFTVRSTPPSYMYLPMISVEQ